MIRGKDIFVVLLTTLVFSACDVNDDVPFPIVEGAITAFEVEGQCNSDDSGFAEANIDRDNMIVDVYVSDRVDVSKLRINRLEVSNDATIHPNPELCLDAEAFPQKSFTSPASGNASRINFSNDSCRFTLHTYQDYDWNVRVHQIVMREIRLAGQVGDAIIDTESHTAIIYVSLTKDLQRLPVISFNLGGQHGSVTPDPTATGTYDFSQMRKFKVTSGTGASTDWRVFVYHTDAIEETTASAFPHSAVAYISGEVPSGAEPVIEYHAEGVTEWTKVNPEQITQKGRNYTAKLTGLKPGTTYTYHVIGGSSQTENKTFTTVVAQQLENANFEEWSILVNENPVKNLYQPWGEGKNPYWGTGNPGATSVGASNSTYSEDPIHGKYANLQSKYIVIKFAAGNIFTGEYLETEGANGVLSFGRPFTAFPTKLKFEFTYQTSSINRVGKWSPYYTKYMTQDFFEGLVGQPDSCSVYVALGDWEPTTYTTKKGDVYTCPYLIRTKPDELHLMNLRDSHLIAYGQMTVGENVPSWKKETITIDYRVTDRQPKYIIVVASSSKYGDYFTGSDESLLQIDNLELLYE